MTKKLVIVGACGNAHDVLDIVAAINTQSVTWEIVGFLDDVKPQGDTVMGYPVLGTLAHAHNLRGAQFINCIGSDRSFRHRQHIIEKLGLDDSSFATLIHPQASVSNQATVGRGCYISFGCCVGGGVKLEAHVSLAPGAIIGHDTRIGDYSILAPATVVSGFVAVGSGCFLGARSVIKQRLHIGDSALIGMGAVVTRDVAAGDTVVGVPAKVSCSISGPFSKIDKNVKQLSKN